MARFSAVALGMFLSVVAYAVHAAPAAELAGALSANSLASPLSANAYLERLRQPVAAAAAPAAGDTGFVPRTAHDNSPYRFNMTQNGRRMTAEEFDAWMKARGIRVATGKPAGSTPAAAASTAATAQACQPTATTAC